MNAPSRLLLQPIEPAETPPADPVKAKIRWMLDHLGYIDINMLDDLDPVHVETRGPEHKADQWGDPDWSENPGAYSASETKRRP